MTSPTETMAAGLTPGDFAPMFVTPSTVNPEFRFDTVGGRPLVVSFLGSSTSPASASALPALAALQNRVAGRDAVIFVVLADPADREGLAPSARCRPLSGNLIVFWDQDFAIARRYGLVDEREQRMALASFVLDWNMRVTAIVPLLDGAAHVAAVGAALDALPPRPPGRLIGRQAPALLIPEVLDRALCQSLIDGFQAHGGRESGSMRETDGKTFESFDTTHKRRRDWLVNDPALYGAIHDAVRRRVLPEIRKAFQFEVTRVERYLVGCYDAARGDFFRAHRDDNVAGTAHRRFAMTINLNEEDYEGGELSFPEYGLDTYRPPTGHAVVFSCALLHQVAAVTRGTRYALLPFFYDEAAEAIRLANAPSVVPTGDQAASTARTGGA